MITPREVLMLNWVINWELEPYKSAKTITGSKSNAKKLIDLMRVIKNWQ